MNGFLINFSIILVCSVRFYQCLNDFNRFNSGLNLRIIQDNITSLSFNNTNFVQLRSGYYVKELNCIYNCKITVNQVNCDRENYSLIWSCFSPSLREFNYVFNYTFVVCDSFVSNNRNKISCFMRYSLKANNNNVQEFDFVLLFSILACFVLIAMVIEFLKKVFGCYTPIIINTSQWNCTKSNERRDLRTAFTSVPPNILKNSFVQDLNQDLKKPTDEKKSADEKKPMDEKKSADEKKSMDEKKLTDEKNSFGHNYV